MGINLKELLKNDNNLDVILEAYPLAEYEQEDRKGNLIVFNSILEEMQYENDFVINDNYESNFLYLSERNSGGVHIKIPYRSEPMSLRYGGYERKIVAYINNITEG